MIKKIFAAVLIFLFAYSNADAAFRRGGVQQTPSGFNNKKTQTNFGLVQGSGDYPFNNELKSAQQWTFGNFAPAPVPPDILDANGYLISSASNAASGIVTVFNIPSQQQHQGPRITKWDGDGANGQPAVDNSLTSGTVVAYTIASITQSGGVQTVNLSSTPVEMRALQPMQITNVVGSGGVDWGGFNNTWRVQDVGIGCASGANCFRVSTTVTYTGSPTLSGTSKATFTGSTTVANVPGNLNGSGRFAFLPDATVGGANGADMHLFIRSIQSPTNYPHNIRVVHIDNEALLDAGDPITPRFRSKISMLGGLRGLNWQDGNITNVSTWNTRKPESYVFYSGYSLVPDFYAGTTTLSADTYTISAPAINSATGAAYSGLTDKTTIHVRFAQSSRQASSFIGTVAFNVGLNQWELTVNSGLTGFIAIGQTLTITGQVANADFKIGSGSGSVWQLIGGPSGGAVSSVSMTTRQNFNSPLATFTAGNPDISIPNNVYQIGDQLNMLDYSGNGTSVLPTGFSFNTRYYVVAATVGPSGTVRLSATSGGAAITPTGVNSSGLIISSIYLFMNAPGTGSGKIPILSEYSGLLSDSSNSYPVADSSRDLATLVYDVTLGSFIKYGGDVSIGSAGILNSVPIEQILAISWSVGAHPWLVSPPLAVDPATDWWPNVMLYDKTNRPSWAKLGIEGPNETWNTGVNFFQTAYAIGKANAYHASDPTNWPGVNDFNNWYGKALSVIGQMAYQVYGAGNLDTTYRLIGGVQTAVAVVGDTGNAYPRFASTSYVNAGAVQSPLIGPWGTITFQAVPTMPNVSQPAATRYVSHIATATYYGSNAYSDRGDGGPQTLASLSAAWGGVRFTASSIVGGLMTIAPFTGPSGLSAAMTVFLPDQTTFTITGGSEGAGWNISDPSLNIPYQQSYMAGLTSGLSAPAALTDSVIDTVVNATVSGCPSSCVFHVNSIISGNTVGGGLQIYGGTSGIAFASGIEIAHGGAYPNFGLTQPTTNQTANFAVGYTSSLTGNFNLYPLWANWWKTNFGGTKTIAYEGGFSNDYFFFPYTLLAQQAKQAASLESYNTQMFDSFRGLGPIALPSGVTGEFPSNYLLTGPYPIGSAWSVLDDIYQNPSSPQWKSIQAYPFLLKRDLDPASNDNDPMWLETAA